MHLFTCNIRKSFQCIWHMGCPHIFTEDLLRFNIEPYYSHACISIMPLKFSGSMQKHGYLLCFQRSGRQEKYIRILLRHALGSDG